MATSAYAALPVSTHSRLKAAGWIGGTIWRWFIGFNTQPPEGGWQRGSQGMGCSSVSTHSRLKAAGKEEAKEWAAQVFQHTAA